MLHIILGILKLIGIILGISVLLVCTALLCILFVPVRYRIRLQREPEQLRGSVQASWLMHSVSVKACMDKDSGGTVLVKLFGIRLFGSGQKKETETQQMRQTSGTQKPPGLYPVPDEEKLHKAHPVSDEEELYKAHPVSDEEGQLRIHPVPDVRETKASKNKCKVKRICDRIKQGRMLGKRLWNWFSGIPDRIRRAYQMLLKAFHKFAGLLHKPEELMELFRRYEIKENLRTLYGYLRDLWKHYCPRRISGYLHFGTGDPALTGQLTGIIYLVLPARADRFTVRPDFEEPVLETDLLCTGHIRLFHFLRICLRAFFDERLRRLIRQIRAKR
ncbi:MAG: DUF2953 domain-containing protein [Lachnospiraceae bacterium]